MAIINLQPPPPPPPDDRSLADPNMIMPFGKYKGNTLRWIAENDVLYLDWLAGIETRGQLKLTVILLANQYEDAIEQAMDDREASCDANIEDTF